MNLLKHLPYGLASSFEDINTDLTLFKQCNEKLSLYSSSRYSEIYLFGKVFDWYCNLWFQNGVLETIDYRFPMHHFILFEESINQELAEDKQLTKDKFFDGFALESYLNGVAISLRKLNDDYFLMRISKHPSLPRIRG
jgi:hypothetical protein